MRVVWFYIYSAFRNLTGPKLVLNLVGLSVGVALSVFVLLFARYELSWDRHFPDYNRIYRFSSVVSIGKVQTLAALSPMPLRDILISQPEVEAAVRLYKGGSGVVEAQDQRFHEGRFFYADKGFFDVFDLPFINGSAQTAFKNPNGLVVTQSTAKRYFGYANPIGKLLKYNDAEFVVSAVVADVPVNTHFHFDFLAETAMIPFFRQQDSAAQKMDLEGNWLSILCYTYAKLKSDVDVDRFSQRINEIKDGLASEQVEAAKQLYRTPDETLVIDFVPEPISHIHYLSKAEFPVEPSIKFSYLAIFISLASLILFFTGINFAYITASSSLTRHSDFQDRLMMGASRLQLFLQLMVETFIYSFIAVFLALVIVELLMPLVNTIFQLKLGLWDSNLHSMGVLVFVFILSVASGIIPSLRFAYRYPVVAQSSGSVVSQRFSFRGAILFFQVVLFAFLLFVSSGIWFQLRSLEEKSPGFDIDRVLVIERGDLLKDNWLVFKKELEEKKEIQKVAFAKSIPGQLHSTISYRLSGSQNDPLALLATNVVSVDYFEVMGHALKNGAFLGAHPGDSMAVMLNERAVEKYGLIKPIGERIEVNYEADGDSVDMIVKGVVGDYHFESYTQPVKPMVVMLTFQQQALGYILIRKGEGFDEDGIKEIETIWKKYLPKVPLQLKELRTYATAQFDDDYRMLRMGFVLLLIAAYVLLTGVFVFTDSVFERHRYVVSVKQLCGASSIRMALEQSHRVFMILCFGVAMALALFSIVFLFYQSNFEVIVVFPWLVTLAGSLFCLLFPGIVFIATHYFLSTRRAFYSDLMKP